MGFFKRFFGGKSESSEDKMEDQSAKNFEVLKYDGVRAMHQGQLDYAIKCLTNALLAKQVDEEGDASKEDQEVLEVRDYLSLALIQKGELAQAYDQLRKLSEAQPDNKQIFVRMAEVKRTNEYKSIVRSAPKPTQTITRKETRHDHDDHISTAIIAAAAISSIDSSSSCCDCGCCDCG